MARIAGVDLPRQQRGVVALTYIFGIGKRSAQDMLAKSNLSEAMHVEEWTEESIRDIANVIENEYSVEGQLRSEVQTDIKRLTDRACYRGLRHRRGLPVRGQRTKTNARTRKGRKKTVANMKKVNQSAD